MHPSARTSAGRPWSALPAGSSDTSGLSKDPPRWGRFFDIGIWLFKVLVEGDYAMAAVRWPLAIALVAAAVAIVGVVFA